MLAKYIVILSTTYFINIAQIFQQKGQKSKRVEVQTTRCGICSQLLIANKGRTVRLEG